MAKIMAGKCTCQGQVRQLLLLLLLQLRLPLLLEKRYCWRWVQLLPLLQAPHQCTS